MNSNYVLNPLHRGSRNNNSNNSYSNNSYSNNSSSNNEYSNQIIQHLDKDIGYPFENLKKEMFLYDKNIEGLNPFQKKFIDYQYNDILDVHVSNNKIDKDTYEYMKKLNELKNKMKYSLHINNNTNKLNNKNLINVLDELISIYKKMNNINNTNILDHLWVYYGQNTKLIDLVFSIYLRYLKYLDEIKEIKKSIIRPYVDHNRKVIEEFIVYLISNGADISNLKQHIITIDYAYNDEIYQQLYNVLLKGFFKKKLDRTKRLNKKPKMTLKNYVKRYIKSNRNVKKVIHRKSAKKLINELLNKGKLPDLPKSIVNSFLKSTS